MIIQEGPLTHKEAWTRFLEIGNLYLDTLYLHAGKGKRQFDIALNLGQVEFRYSTIIKDKRNVPITISSWESLYGLDGKLCPPKEPHHYIQLGNKSSQPLRLDERINFEQGTHPRSFMRKLRYAIPNIRYGDGSKFVRDAIKQGVPFNRI